jgi:glucose/arabinose dehydrogenase
MPKVGGKTALACALVLILPLIGACANPRIAAFPEPDAPVAAPRDLPPIPPPKAAAARVPPGYRVEVVMSQLIYPSSVEFDDKGNMYVAEAGYVYGDVWGVPRILKVSIEGKIALLTDHLNAPVNDLLWHEGTLYVSHMGKISTVSTTTGEVTDLVTGLPSNGDHQNNQLTFDPDGNLYFGQGTVTNSGVVGIDNFFYFWLPYYPMLHDKPAKPIRLCDRTYITGNPFLFAGSFDISGLDDPPLAQTAPFHPFGQDLENELIPGVTKANGTVLRLNPDGSQLEVYAWGFRNPFGLAWGPDGRLYAAENGFDERGSRPIANDTDDLYIVKQDAWYGWPDFAAGIPVTDPRFRPEQGPQPQFLMQEHPPVEKPLMVFPQHSGVTKIGFSTSGRFGKKDDLFLPLFGPLTPLTGKQETPAKPGPQVARINPKTQRIETFFASVQPYSSGIEDAATSGPRRPVDVVFAQDGKAMYIVDIGAIPMVDTPVPLTRPFPGSGVIWRVVPEGVKVEGPPADLAPLPRVGQQH